IDEITAHSTVTVPYRALVPAEVDGLLVACRAFSSNDEANAYFNLIPHCMCLGQAAGTAAAIATARGINVREVPYEELRQALLEQNVCLPDK
ncbi:MAG: FAD-dependent oxidoreductase, partial [Parasporobacterium sp.]|nr:FAD-dependent oxidoreductase [Parasporobacterium sp.]